jgi:type IV pilus assembly protein PilF
MTHPRAALRDTRKFLAWAALAGTLLLTLGGCAGGPRGASGGATADPVTESDEPEARRRARIRMELAVGYFGEGKTSIALDELKQVIALDPSFPDAYNLRGLIFMRLNDNRQAEESFRRAVALNPRDGNVQHNFGWLMCTEKRWEEANRAFEAALASPVYGERAKTLLTQGICEARAGRVPEAERALARSYELDAANPITGYNLANLLYRRGDFSRAQFYIRRLNNSEAANSETLWLGVRVERKLGDRTAMQQLGEQLKKRFPQTREAVAYDRGQFDE